MNSNKLDHTIKGYKDLLEALLSREHLSFDNKNLRTMLPEEKGVYCISDKTEDTIVYIGQSKNLQKRIYRNHLLGSQRSSTLRRKIIKSGKYLSEDQAGNYLHEQCMVQFIKIEDEPERHSFEHFAIAILKPEFND